MKKIARILFVAAIASVALVSCKKDQKPAKDNNQEQNQDQDQNQGQDQEEVKLAIDGKFGEWASISPVEGQDAILLTKTQVTEKKLYFYMEADTADLLTDKYAFANYLHLYLDCGGDTAEGVSYWGGETGASYDIVSEIWLMQNGAANTTSFSGYGFSGKAKIENGIFKIEFSLDRSSNELLENNILYYGMALTDTYCDTSSGSEQWLGGELTGLAPAQDSDMAKVK